MVSNLLSQLVVDGFLGNFRKLAGPLYLIWSSKPQLNVKKLLLVLSTFTLLFKKNVACRKCNKKISSLIVLNKTKLILLKAISVIRSNQKMSSPKINKMYLEYLWPHNEHKNGAFFRNPMAHSPVAAKCPWWEGWTKNAIITWKYLRVGNWICCRAVEMQKSRSASRMQRGAEGVSLNPFCDQFFFWNSTPKKAVQQFDQRGVKIAVPQFISYGGSVKWHRTTSSTWIKNEPTLCMCRTCENQRALWGNKLGAIKCTGARRLSQQQK